MKTVPLGGQKAAGRVALVDDEDCALVSQYNWYVQEDTRPGHRSGPYARTTVYDPASGKTTALFMHALIAGYPRPDHADGNGLNNQRSNLRPATPGQNGANKRKRLSATSRYIGVHRANREDRWKATITCDGKRRWLGTFVSEEKAARAYDDAARELFGEFARLNFPTQAVAEARDAERKAGLLVAEFAALGVNMIPIVHAHGTRLEIDADAASKLLELLRGRDAA